MEFVFERPGNTVRKGKSVGDIFCPVLPSQIRVSIFEPPLFSISNAAERYFITLHHTISILIHPSKKKSLLKTLVTSIFSFSHTVFKSLLFNPFPHNDTF